MAATYFVKPEGEAEASRWLSSIKRAAKVVLPHAKKIALRVGSDLLRQMAQGQPAHSQHHRQAAHHSQHNRHMQGQPGSQPAYSHHNQHIAQGQPGSQPAYSPRNQQIGALFQRLGRLFAQAESETANHEAHLFGTNEYEAEISAHEAAHEAALTEVMAAEASHTESESEAQALLGAAIPLSIRVMGGKVGMRRITPTLVRVNAQLVLNLHRQGRPGRLLIRTVPAIQRRTLATLNAIQRTGQPVTPDVARQVMAGQAARVLGTPHICGRALTRNISIRNRTVAPTRPTSARTSM